MPPVAPERNGQRSGQRSHGGGQGNGGKKGREGHGYGRYSDQNKISVQAFKGKIEDLATLSTKDEKGGTPS